MKVAQKHANNDSNRSATEATQSNWQNQLVQASNDSKQAAAQRAVIEGINDSPRMLAQRRQIDGYLGSSQQQATAPPHPAWQNDQQQIVQRAKKMDDEEGNPLQGKFTTQEPAQLEQQLTAKSNNTGLPDNLKSGIETLSGISMDNVRVHYSSTKPAQLNALAYAQGTDIHIAQGEDQYLPHEAWHVVQQAQGKVRPTMQMKEGIPVNDDQGLEHEADMMGMKALKQGDLDSVATGLTEQAITSSLVKRESREASKMASVVIGDSMEKMSLNFLSTHQITNKQPTTTTQYQPQAGIFNNSSQTPTIQRGIKKGARGELYKNAPASYLGDKLSPSVRKELQSIIENNEKRPKDGKDFTILQAIRLAKERVEQSGRFETGRTGDRIHDTTEMVDFLKQKNADTSTVESKFTNHPLIWNNLFSKVEIVKEDFKQVKTTGGADGVWSNFTSLITTTVPQLTRTISSFNEVVDDMVANDKNTGSALKGSMFEKWTLDNVLTSAGNRITFDQQGKMSQARTSDGYEARTGTLWDMKHYYDKVSPSTNKNQAADYYEIVTKGYLDSTGTNKASTINYLFPNMDAAKANDWLSTFYGFGVYYVKSPTTLVKYA